MAKFTDSIQPQIVLDTHAGDAMQQRLVYLRENLRPIVRGCTQQAMSAQEAKQFTKVQGVIENLYALGIGTVLKEPLPEDREQLKARFEASQQFVDANIDAHGKGDSATLEKVKALYGCVRKRVEYEVTYGSTERSPGRPLH